MMLYNVNKMKGAQRAKTDVLLCGIWPILE